MTRAPSPRQLDVLGFVAQHLRTLGYAPTLEDLCTKFDWASKHTAWLHITALEAKGLLNRKAKSARAISLTRAARRYLPSEVRP